MSARSTLLLEHHLKELKLPTFLREYRKLATQCAAEGADHPDYLLRLAELELIDRHQRMVQRRIRAARFPATKSLDTFDFLDRRQLVLPVASTIFAGRYGVIIRYGGTVDYRPTNQAIEAETYGRQDTGNGSGQGWDERAFSAQVAEWPIAVAGETGASVAHSAGSLRRGVGG